MQDETKVRINGAIVAPSVRVIDSDGNMLGVMETAQALALARSKNLDLIEVSPNAEPPVCKVTDFGKLKYGIQKKLHKAKKKQKIIETKEVKLRPNIAEGDYIVKLRHVKKFLEEGNKVRIALAFKGREITHEEIGFQIMERFVKDLENGAKVDYGPKMEGRQIVLLVSAN
jgi:translation initiation factor IF-3